MCKHNFKFDRFVSSEKGYVEEWMCYKCGKVERRKSGPMGVLLVLVLIAAIAVMVVGFLI
jgi:hypothetical protein